MKAHDEFCAAAPGQPCSCPDVQDAIDGRDPAAIEHLCARDLRIHDGPVEECCAALWIDEGVSV